MKKPKITFTMKVIPDTDPDTSYLDQKCFEDRKKQYEQGDFYFVGVKAIAHVEIPYESGCILQDIQSPGLWGIESDSSDEHLKEIYNEELAVVKSMLEELKKVTLAKAEGKE